MSTRPNSIEKPAPFWKTKTLEQMTKEEWESLCDGCGRCCLNKLEDWDTGEIFWTDIACSQLDCDTCRCRNYQKRASIVPDCIDLTPEKIAELTWLPPTCGYRLLQEGKDLPDWHPLVTGDPNSVHKAGISVRGRVRSEGDYSPDDYEDFIVTWPGEDG